MGVGAGGHGAVGRDVVDRIGDTGLDSVRGVVEAYEERYSRA